MGFESLDTEAGIAQLNQYIVDKSYIDGFAASQADVAVFEAVKRDLVLLKKYPHAARWYNHIKAHQDSFSRLPGSKKPACEYGPAVCAVGKAKAADDDDIDLFGSESEDEEVKRGKAERLAAYNAKKSLKPGPVAKSNVVLDIKPWDDTTDLAELEKGVRAITMDGLIWGASNLVPIGYGIKKLRIACVVEDAKVDMEMVEEAITELGEMVQSMDIVSFDKV